MRESAGGYFRRCPNAVVPSQDDRAWSGLQPSRTVRQRGSAKSARGPPHLLPRPWPLPTTLRPWSVLPRGPRSTGQIKFNGTSQVKSSQPGRRPGESTLTQRCNAGRPRLPEGSSRLVIKHASVLPHTVCRASLARPRHARSRRVSPSQVKSSQVKCAPCRSRAGRRGTRLAHASHTRPAEARTPPPLRTRLPRARTHGCDPR